MVRPSPDPDVAGVRGPARRGGGDGRRTDLDAGRAPARPADGPARRAGVRPAPAPAARRASGRRWPRARCSASSWPSPRRCTWSSPLGAVLAWIGLRLARWPLRTGADHPGRLRAVPRALDPARRCGPPGSRSASSASTTRAWAPRHRAIWGLAPGGPTSVAWAGIPLLLVALLAVAARQVLDARPWSCWRRPSGCWPRPPGWIRSPGCCGRSWGWGCSGRGCSCCWPRPARPARGGRGGRPRVGGRAAVRGLGGVHRRAGRGVVGGAGDPGRGHGNRHPAGGGPRCPVPGAAPIPGPGSSRRPVALRRGQWPAGAPG